MISNEPPAIVQEYICGGGYTDRYGISWQSVGRFLSTEKDMMRNHELFCKYRPFIDKENTPADLDMPPENKIRRVR